jgi:hypothetical protein
MFELSWLCSDVVCLSPKKGHNIYSMALFLGGEDMILVAPSNVMGLLNHVA